MVSSLQDASLTVYGRFSCSFLTTNFSLPRSGPPSRCCRYSCRSNSLCSRPIQKFKMLNGNLTIQHGSVESRFPRRKNNHEIRIRGEFQNKQIKPHPRLVLHTNKLLSVSWRSRKARNTLLEVLHNIRHALQSVLCWIPLSLR